MLKRLTDTKHFYIACVILAIPSIGCSEASEAEDEQSSKTPGTLEDAAQDPAPDPEPVSAPDATMASADGRGDSPTTEPSGALSANGPQPSGTASDDIDTPPLPGEPPEPPGSESQPGSPAPADAGDAPAQPSSDPDTEAPNEEAVQASCLALAGDDPCETCVCESCVVQLDSCANTTGCPEILQCVRESGCLELECYCGDSPLPNCLAGEGNGPCRDAVLSAPGGREPDAINPSGGPASDAALAVSECSASTCRDACE